MTTTARRTHRTMCPMNCHPTYCGMVVEIEDDPGTHGAGHVVAIRGDKDNPDSRGFLCIRGRSAGEIIDNPARILSPRIRVPGSKGTPSDVEPGTWNLEPHNGIWRDASWDEALDRIVAAIRAAGPEAVAL